MYSQVFLYERIDEEYIDSYNDCRIKGQFQSSRTESCPQVSAGVLPRYDLETVQYVIH